MLELAKGAVGEARRRGLGVVIDADGLLIVQNHPEVVEGYKPAILTPNLVEFARLCKALGVEVRESEDGENCRRLAERLGGVTVVQKGGVDWISNGEWVKRCEVKGGLKRSGGQGDTLSGVAGTMLAWRKGYLDEVWEYAALINSLYGTLTRSSHGDRLRPDDLVMLAAFGASAITRLCSRRAYEKKGRSMQAGDLPLEIHQVFIDLFEKGPPRDEVLLH